MGNFPGKDANGWKYGADCHQQKHGSFPVWVITDIFGNILISNECHDDKGEPKWVVTKGRVTITRFWAASTAMVVCSINNPSNSYQFKDLPNNIMRPWLKQGQVKYSVDPPTSIPLMPLDKSDEICIWGGYIDEIRAVTPEDLKEGRLFRFFVGVIDTIIGTNTSTQGVNLVIQARDRMKYLMDSVTTYNSSDFAPIGLDANTEQPQSGALNTDTNNLHRSEVLIEIARRCVGHLENSYSISNGNYAQQCASVCGMRISYGYILDLRAGILTLKDNVLNEYQELPSIIHSVYGPLNTGIDYYGMDYIGDYDANNYIIPNTTYEKKEEYRKSNIPFIGGRVDTPGGFNDKPLALRALMPCMNVITGRSVFALDEKKRNVAGMPAQITDRVPVEYIKFMALQEPWPTEFFCDHRSGEYWYAPRGLDITGLDSKERLNRVYFHCSVSSEYVTALTDNAISTPHHAQVFTTFREESSAINWRSNIIVVDEINTYFKNTDGVHLKIVPKFLRGRAFAASYYTVIDQTINSDSTELVATALSFARLYGKELKAATMHIIGDPSLCPGEAVQVVGSPLNGSMTLQEYKDERNNIFEISQSANKVDEALAQLQTGSNEDSENYLSGLSGGLESVQMEDQAHAQTMCPAYFTGGNTDPNNLNTSFNTSATGDRNTYPEDPKSIWRVEAIIHKLNNTPGDGWKTELALLPPW